MILLNVHLCLCILWSLRTLHKEHTGKHLPISAPRSRAMPRSGRWFKADGSAAAFLLRTSITQVSFTSSGGKGPKKSLNSPSSNERLRLSQNTTEQKGPSDMLWWRMRDVRAVSEMFCVSCSAGFSRDCCVLPLPALHLLFLLQAGAQLSPEDE